MKTLKALFVLCLFVSFPVLAQDMGSLDKRLELAQKMHDIRPTKDQVETAIDEVAATQPPSERESFKTAMRGALNYKAIEKISIDAMAEIYSEKELQSMLDYYSKPEAMSAIDKERDYAEKVYPEITKMLDQALMRVKTGEQ
jgi:hypothetical protein